MSHTDSSTGADADTHTGTDTRPTSIDQNRSTAMSLMYEELARAQMSARLGEAQQLRAGRHLSRARRLSRKAEQSAQQARLAVARAL
jgi:hypothetical protein